MISFFLARCSIPVGDASACSFTEYHVIIYLPFLGALHAKGHCRMLDLGCLVTFSEYIMAGSFTRAGQQSLGLKGLGGYALLSFFEVNPYR